MISSYIKLLEREVKDNLNEASTDCLYFTVDGAQRMPACRNAALWRAGMRVLINDLLSYLRITSNTKPFEKINLNILLEETLKTMKVALEEKNAKITKESLPFVLDDPVQIARLMQNLISIKDNGIGLAVCKKIVERHGGNIWLESQGEGKGSTFYLSLSVAHE